MTFGVLCLTSCTGFYQPVETLAGHDNWVVVGTAYPGLLAGSFAGLPIGIAALFFGGMVGVDPGPADGTGLGLAPAGFLGQAGAIVTGGIPWLLVTAIEPDSQ